MCIGYINDPAERQEYERWLHRYEPSYFAVHMRIAEREARSEDLRRERRRRQEVTASSGYHDFWLAA